MPILLVPPNQEFAEEFLKWRRDPITIEYNPLESSSVESLRERLAKAGSDLSKLDSTKEYLWFIRESEGTQLLGQVSLQRVNLQMLTGEVGYTIAPCSRGKGIGTQAVRLLTKTVFENTSLRKLIALVHRENVASRRILEKVGYKQEGILREHFLVNGHPTDEVLYGILRRDLSK